MIIRNRVPLSLHSTMRLGGEAAFATEVHTRSDLCEAVEWAKARNLPTLMIGHGSNIVWHDSGYEGLLLINNIRRYEVCEKGGDSFYVTVGAGEVLDDIARRTASDGLTGIEALSLIPGTVGATPVQNVGAYGQEVSQTLVSVEAYDTMLNEYVTIPGGDCGFGYRTSRFKTADRDRFYITAVTFNLLRQSPKPPFYSGLQSYFEQHDIHSYTSLVIREAVIDIRSQKLPDSAKIPNNGSFFANPIIPVDAFAQLQSMYPNIPHWPVSETSLVKIPAAWLIEQAGLRGVKDEATGMATWHCQPLVLVNEHATSTAQLLAFKKRVVDTVNQKFSITLVQEPDLFPRE